MAFAGRRTGLEWLRVLNLFMMLSMWWRISGRIGTACFLDHPVSTNSLSTSTYFRNSPIVRHVQNLLLGPDSDFLQNLLPRVLRDVMTGHDALALLDVSC